MILYFAYGSNLDCGQMRSRCPSSQFVCRAVLKDHSLAFTRFSTSRQCGVADAVHQPGRDVWGVVYQINEKDLPSMDRAEGFRPERKPRENAYNRRDDVQVLAEGDANRHLTVATYFATQQNTWVAPSDGYVRQIVDGAKFWQLPQSYIQELQQLKAAP